MAKEAKAKKVKEPKFKKVEDMSADELRKHIPAEQARAERLAAVGDDLGPGWKMAAESVLTHLAVAKDRLAELEEK